MEMLWCFVVFLCGHLLVTSAQSGQFVWTKNTINYPSSDQQLTRSSLTTTYSNAYLVTQCAYRCLQTTEAQCASFNFIPASRLCQLNSDSHVTKPNSLLPVSGSQYYLRDAFSIDQVCQFIDQVKWCVLCQFSELV